MELSGIHLYYRKLLAVNISHKNSPTLFVNICIIKYRWKSHYPQRHSQLSRWQFFSNMSSDMIFPTMRFVRPAKAQTSLCICADWSEPLLVAWIFFEYKTSARIFFGVSKLKEAANARLSLHLSKCHIVGNHMSRLIYFFEENVRLQLEKEDFDWKRNIKIWFGNHNL